jgi:hypothetical protein
MTEQPTPDPVNGDRYARASPGMPRWVPVLIGLLLVSLAALAVFTGLRYRERGDTQTARQRGPRVEAPAPPGEPEAGASRVFHGEDANLTPDANAAVRGQARAVVTGGPEGVQSVVRVWARQGMVLAVQPPESMVYVNGTLIGHANQFDTEEEAYEFAAPGSYNVRVVGPGGNERTFVVTSAEDAKQDVARLEAAL